MKDGAILANAGHFDVEIDLGELARVASANRAVRPLVEEFEVGGRRLNLLAARARRQPRRRRGPPVRRHGSVVRHAGARRRGSRARRRWAAARVSTPFPAALDREVARLKLDALGVTIDELTAEQASYRTSWVPAPHED